jgi:excinuclease ABC subunit A
MQPDIIGLMSYIEISGANKHNLKNVSLKIPRYLITAVTGVSGSGKSSLVIDTIHEESQRQYQQILSLNRMSYQHLFKRNNTQQISNLSPAIAIDQFYSNYNKNMTVSRLSGMEHYIRMLFINNYILKCYKCGKILEYHSLSEIGSIIKSKYFDKKIYIYAPLKPDLKRNIKKQLEKYLRKGFIKIKVNKKIFYLDEEFSLDEDEVQEINLLVDVIKVDKMKTLHLDESIRLALDEGDGNLLVEAEGGNELFSTNLFCDDCQISLREPIYTDFNPGIISNQCSACQGRGETKGFNCLTCLGSGLKENTLSCYYHNYNYAQLMNLKISEVKDFFKKILTDEGEELIRMSLRNVIRRTEIFSGLSLDYLSLNRKVETLSGGELQRSRIVGQLNGGLSDIIYILDEPSIGMHPSEQDKLVEILKSLKDKGNTIIIVEHERRMIKGADYIIELGPKAGIEGGNITYSGSVDDYTLLNRVGIKYQLIKEFKLSEQKSRKKGFIKINNLSLRNIENVNVRILKESINVITGVSGSGKTTLVKDLLYPKLTELLKNQNDLNDPDGIRGLGKVIIIDQKMPLIKKSTDIASFLKILSPIRKLYAQLLESRKRGYSTLNFDYLKPAGWCETCRGKGYLREYGDTFKALRVICNECRGKRFNHETPSINYKGKSIYDILQISLQESLEIFRSIPIVRDKLQLMIEMGLKYLQLGQEVKSLSGGELQRLKLCRELQKGNKSKNLFIFDEPTIGMHNKEVDKLLKIFKILVGRGNTLVVIEHNSDIILNADYIIEMGPSGGDAGGRIIFNGRVDEILKCKNSKIAKYLIEEINGV